MGRLSVKREGRKGFWLVRRAVVSWGKLGSAYRHRVGASFGGDFLCLFDRSIGVLSVPEAHESSST